MQAKLFGRVPSWLVSGMAFSWHLARMTACLQSPQYARPLLQTIITDATVHCLGWCPPKKWLIAGGNGELRVYQVSNPPCMQLPHCSPAVLCLCCTTGSLPQYSAQEEHADLGHLSSSLCRHPSSSARLAGPGISRLCQSGRRCSLWLRSHCGGHDAACQHRLCGGCRWTLPMRPGPACSSALRPAWLTGPP